MVLDLLMVALCLVNAGVAMYDRNIHSLLGWVCGGLGYLTCFLMG